MIIFWITDFAPGAFVILTITALAVTGPRFRYSKGSSHFLISAKAFKELPVLFLCCFRRFGVDGTGSLIIRILGFTGAPGQQRGGEIPEFGVFGNLGTFCRQTGPGPCSLLQQRGVPAGQDAQVAEK